MTKDAEEGKLVTDPDTGVTEYVGPTHVNWPYDGTAKEYYAEAAAERAAQLDLLDHDVPIQHDDEEDVDRVSRYATKSELVSYLQARHPDASTKGTKADLLALADRLDEEQEAQADVQNSTDSVDADQLAESRGDAE